MDNFAICSLTCIPCRAEPSDRSEMVSQLLLGEIFEILQEQGMWIKIKSLSDNYESWIDKKQATQISEKFLANYLSESPQRCSSLTGYAHLPDGRKIIVPFGARLPLLNGNTFYLGEQSLSFSGEISQNAVPWLVPYLKTLLETPYLWGGRSPFGIDCSGFVQIGFALCGISLPRDAWQQAGEGQRMEAPMEGDLAFFKNKDNKITHVGVVLEGNKIIHASGKVRIDSLSPEGIVNDKKELTHNLSHFTRVIGQKN